jgi:UDP-N-acetylmuramoyl-tripeptide--D-alanyl-D-alanine ligase
MTHFAKVALLRHRPYVIGITGSVGKTTTKDAVAHVLSQTFRVRKSEKSFNSEIGIPLAVLGLPNEWKSFSGWAKNLFKAYCEAYRTQSFPDVLVLEIGADKPGDIEHAVAWIKPYVGVLTRLPDTPVHVEQFSSPELVRVEKAKLIHALPDTGIFVANMDDDRIRSLSEQVPVQVFGYGFHAHAAIRGGQIRVTYAPVDGTQKPTGMSMGVSYEGKTDEVHIHGVLGEHIMSAALAALSVALAKGMTLEQACLALSSWETAPGRMRIIDGISGSIIIDDSYNASPVAVHAALDVLQSLTAHHRIAVLGDMLELGQYSDEEHRKVGAHVALFADALVVVGRRARGIAEAAIASGMNKERVQMFTNSVEAGEALSRVVGSGDVILVKGSQGSGENMIRMERATKQLMAQKDAARNLLVRQDDEWQKQYM